MPGARRRCGAVDEVCRDQLRFDGVQRDWEYDATSDELGNVDQLLRDPEIVDHMRCESSVCCAAAAIADDVRAVAPTGRRLSRRLRVAERDLVFSDR